MILSHKCGLVIYLILEIIGIILFLQGFFPIKHFVPGYAAKDDLSPEPLPTYLGNGNLTWHPPILYKRLVFILIDALRADFVLPSTTSDLPHLPFVESLVETNSAHAFVAKAHPPTVTLPRIKALMTGGIPGFIDVILNFDSNALQEDNVIGQLRRAGRRAAFYGDDTWIKLFPDHFIRAEGTTSFFVTDYTEVDNNVTRHIEDEMSRGDWDVLILHYLGLDHIGHLAGPKSPLIKPKLQEMDDIIQMIHHNLIQRDAGGDGPTLLVVCGDHGMSDQGSHGGATTSETATPLVFVSSLLQGGAGSGFGGEEVQQIDVAPTIALALGLPVPRNSLGSVIPEVLGALTMRGRLSASYMNAEQLLRVLMENDPGYEKESAYLEYDRAVRAHRIWLETHHSGTHGSGDPETHGLKVIRMYTSAMLKMSEKVASSLTRYDLHAMGVGVVMLWLVMVGLVLLLLDIQHGGLQGVLPAFTAGSALLVSLTTGLSLFVHAVLCTSHAGSPLFCHSRVLACCLVAALGAVTGYVICKVIQWRPLLVNIATLIGCLNPLTGILLFGSVVHTFTLLASSFVEEEHQTWYFFTVTYHVLSTALLAQRLVGSMVVRGENGTKSKEMKEADTASHVAKNITSQRKAPEKTDDNKDTSVKDSSNFLMKVINRARQQKREAKKGDSREYHQLCAKCNKTTKRYEEVSVSPHNTPTSRTSLMAAIRGHTDVFGHLISNLALLLLCRMAREWNRTGDKWSHLPDVGDWLVCPENRVTLSALCVLSLIATSHVIVRRNQSLHLRILFPLGACFVYMFRAANGSLSFPWLYGTHASKGVTEARVVYVVIFLMGVTTLWRTIVGGNNTEPLESRPRGPHEIHNAGQLGHDTHPGGSRQHGARRVGRVTRIWQDVHSGWVLLMMLLVRPHNIPLVAIVVLQEYCVSRCLDYWGPRAVPVWAQTLLYFWMGQAAFYYQGNSNSIATVDVSAGYIGLEDYSPTLIGLLMALSTYAGPIFWLLSLQAQLSRSQTQESRYRKSVLCSCAVLGALRALPLAVYCLLVTAQRYHLFVWSVFSPKLLYEGMHTVVMTTLIVLTLALSQLR